MKNRCPMLDDCPKQVLDLRTTKCPLNFVQTRLALEKLAIGETLEVWIQAGGESALNIPTSIQQEGHEVLHTEILADGLQKLRIRRCR